MDNEVLFFICHRDAITPEELMDMCKRLEVIV